MRCKGDDVLGRESLKNAVPTAVTEGSMQKWAGTAGTHGISALNACTEGEVRLLTTEQVINLEE